MGAINPARLRGTVPGTDSGNPRHQRGWLQVVKSMINLNDPVPAIAPGDFPVVDLPATALAIANHVAAHIGVKIADEITNDPEGRNYAGAPNDAAIADLMNDPFTVNAGFRNQTVLLKRTGAPVGNTITIQAENGEPQTLSTFLPALPGVFIEFYALTPTVALQGTRVPVTSLTDVTVDLQSIPAGMTDDDLFRVVQSAVDRRPSRRSVLYQRVPFSPRTITAQDVTDAKA